MTSQSVNYDIPLNHPVYPFVEQIHAKYHFLFPGLNQKPWTSEQLVSFLKVLHEQDSTHSVLQPEERRELQEYLLEFISKETDQKWQHYPIAKKIYHSLPFKKYIYQWDWHFYQYKDSKFLISLDPQMRLVRVANRKYDETEMHLSTGYSIIGNFDGWLHFYWNLLDNQHSGLKNVIHRSVYKNSGYTFITPSENSFAWDENVFFVQMKFKNLRFQAGRNYLQWGPGERDFILLSTNAPAFDQIKFQFSGEHFNYTIVNGKLFAPVDSILFGRNMPYVRKYLAAQRIDWFPAFWISLGWSQLIIYGKRDPELGYLLPFSFFKSSEHYYGDKDNGLMALDAQIVPFKGLIFYGAWLIDDMTTSKLGTDFYGNKFAFQTGFKWYNPPKFPGLKKAVAEYIRIEPYVYTHILGDHTEYKHYDSPLGSFLQPNSDMVYLNLQFRIADKVEMQAEYEYLRHGENSDDVNWGGDIDRPHQAGDPENVPFLSGKKVYTSRYFFTVRWQYFHRSHLFLTVGRDKSTGMDPQTKIWAGITLQFGYRPYRPIYRF